MAENTPYSGYPTSYRVSFNNLISPESMEYLQITVHTFDILVQNGGLQTAEI